MRKQHLKGCLICLFLLVISVPSIAFAADEKVKVSIPDFSVTVNGVKYDSRYSEYPFLLRNDITYMPMTYDFSTFMGINITFDEGVNNVYHKGEMILHIGNAKRTSEQLGQYKKTTSNNSVYDAVIPTYHTYISYTDNEYNNDSLYPIINFRGVTYLPLTWDVMHTWLDWDYTFDSQKGLIIDSTKSVRPKGVNKTLFNRMGTSTDEILMGEHCYLRYDIDIYGAGNIHWVTAEGIKEYYMGDILRGKINYFNRMYNDDNVLVQADIMPSISENVLTIMCARKDGGIANVMLTIDLATGEVLQAREIK